MPEINMFGLIENEVPVSDENLSRIKKEEEYKKYIDTHIANVIKAYNDIVQDNWINSVYNTDILEAIELLGENIHNHDASKYSDSEFHAYRVRYYPVTEEEKENAKLDENWEPYADAWKHHYQNNAHHPEHWIRDGIIEDMPLDKIIEMICDWQSFDYLGLDNAITYWDKNKEEKMKVMSPNTIKQVNRIIDILRKEEK